MKKDHFMKNIFEPLIPGYIAYNASLLLEQVKRINDLSKELNEEYGSNLEGITTEESNASKIGFLLCGLFDLMSIVSPALFAINFPETRDYVGALFSISFLAGAGRSYVYDKYQNLIKGGEEHINRLNQLLNKSK